MELARLDRRTLDGGGRGLDPRTECVSACSAVQLRLRVFETGRTDAMRERRIRVF
jgi:hypothetical protein